jgi:hypothetical protein
MNLHEVIYQVVNSPSLANHVLQNSQILLQKFNLAPAEAQAIVNLLHNSKAMELLLSAQALPGATLSGIENAWVPPQWP